MRRQAEMRERRVLRGGRMKGCGGWRGFGDEVAGDNVGLGGHGVGMRWVLMLFVVLAAVMGGEAWAVVVMGRVVMSERVGKMEVGEMESEGLPTATRGVDRRRRAGGGRGSGGMERGTGGRAGESARGRHGDMESRSAERARVPGRSFGDPGARHLPDAEGVVTLEPNGKPDGIFHTGPKAPKKK